MAEREHQEKLPQGSPVDHQDASASEANSQIANLMRLVEDLTKKYNSQQSQMENITAKNQILKNQLMSINSQAAYSYYYNPYAGYSAAVNAGGWNQATPQYPQGTRNATYSPVAPMQPLSTPRNTTGNESRAQQQQQQQQQHQHPAYGFDSRRGPTTGRRSTLDPSATTERPIPPGTMNVEDMMRSFVSEEMRTLEAQIEQRFSSQIHRATTSTPGFDDLARGIRETPLTSRITNT
ncbi:hypothetical protein TIFTF001_008816 [Ficus carica]|uniref:Uncharacterized protein n=1 Tax=Ficus carica TaxID=3494 RepID=A0AA88D225_FICCA|nr:hypothetical protein TIFTF001_008816 [Ficus carica]